MGEWKAREDAAALGWAANPAARRRRAGRVRSEAVQAGSGAPCLLPPQRARLSWRSSRGLRWRARWYTALHEVRWKVQCTSSSVFTCMQG